MKNFLIHFSIWTCHFTIFILNVYFYISIKAPGKPIYFWDKLLYELSLVFVFYAIATLAFGLCKQVWQAILMTIGIYVVYLFLQYLIDFVWLDFTSPGHDKVKFEFKHLIATHTYYFLLYGGLGAGYWFFKKTVQREKSLRIAEQEKALAEQETLIAKLAFLQAQINPHFLYNTLNYFCSLAYPFSKELTEGIIKLSSIMRYALQETPDSRVALTEEILHLKNLISLQQARFKNELNISFQVDGPLENKRILPLILISFVENAFKHGLIDENDPLLIHVKAKEHEIAFSIKNKKAENKEVHSTKVGNLNVQNRLQLAYANRYQLQIQEDEYYYACDLVIND